MREHHLEPAPGAGDTFPECLRPEVAELALAVYRDRTARGEAGDALADWLAAEGAVLGAHAASPARWMPGGDLLGESAADEPAGDTAPENCEES